MDRRSSLCSSFTSPPPFAIAIGDSILIINPKDSLVTDTLFYLISTYGYFVLGLLIALESAGLPLPGETALLVAGAYAGNSGLSVKLVILVAASAAILGDAAGYWLGRSMGRSLMVKYGNSFWLNQKRLQRIESFFHKHGPKTVFFGRFIGILRTYSAFFAGVSRMSYKSFTVFNASGGALWAIIFGFLGYEFGRNLESIERITTSIGWAALLIILLLLGAYVLSRKRKRSYP